MRDLAPWEQRGTIGLDVESAVIAEASAVDRLQSAQNRETQMNADVSFRCPECGQQVEDGVIEMIFKLSDTHVTVGNVPAKVCPNCGQEFVDGYVAENVNRLVDRVVEDVDSYAKKVVRLPVTPRQIAITA